MNMAETINTRTLEIQTRADKTKFVKAHDGAELHINSDLDTISSLLDIYAGALRNELNQNYRGGDVTRELKNIQSMLRGTFNRVYAPQAISSEYFTAPEAKRIADHVNAVLEVLTPGK